MVKLLSTLPAQVLEPLCGPRHSRFDRSTCAHPSPWRCGCTGGPPPSAPRRRPHPTTTPRGRSWRRFRSRAGTANRLLALPVRRTLERRRQRGVRPQRLQYPRRHPAPRPHATGRAGRAPATHRAVSCSTRTPVSRSPSFAARTPRRRPDRSRRLAVGRLVQGRPRLGRATPPRFRQRPAQPACRRRKGQLRQGFPRRQRLATAQPGFRCEFVARQVEVKAAYRLWVSANEKRAMAEVLDHC